MLSYSLSEPLQISGTQKQEMRDSLHVMMPRQVVDDLISSQRMPGKNNICVTFMFCEVNIRVYVFISLREIFIVRADNFGPACLDVYGLYSIEGIISLSIDEVKIIAAEGVAKVIVKRVGVKISVNASYSDE